MNFKGFEFDENTKQTLNALDVQGRIPHAVIIESKDKTKSFELAKFLSMYAVCIDTERPCGQCGQCRKAFNAAHADIKYAYPEKKSKSYSIDQKTHILSRMKLRQRFIFLRTRKTGCLLLCRMLF